MANFSKICNWLRKKKVDFSTHVISVNGQTFDVNEKSDLLDLEKLFNADMCYFRIFDAKTGRYMATGYNDKGLDALKASYMAYVSNDTDESDIAELKSYPMAKFIWHLEYSGFIIERSFRKFPGYHD